MGQKVNPIGFRTGISKQSSARWFAKGNYAEYLREDLRIRKYIEKKFDAAGVAQIVIERAAANMRVNIYSSRPGIIIGKKGAGAESLKEELIRICKIKSGEPNVNVYEVPKPDLDATLVAKNIKVQLQRRVSFRRAMKKAMGAAIKAGAKGIRIRCGGRLGGADMSRAESYREGRVPLHTLRADIDYGTAEAATTYGIIGIKVWIFKGDTIDS